MLCNEFLDEQEEKIENESGEKIQRRTEYGEKRSGNKGNKGILEREKVSDSGLFFVRIYHVPVSGVFCPVAGGGCNKGRRR